MKMLLTRNVMRILAIFLAFPFWVITTVMLFIITIGEYKGAYAWALATGSFIGALSLSYIAVTGHAKNPL
ncbi:hypothetical protein [Pseudoalteromonas luteoviolacea]|uniref:Uncharacterized protein n=1 Tax=Pseudoalteromonas luteoviolacea S4060-1 TaxID=1365257 RepID=A0A162AL20_9GAMM|nr:hypothetical protein [Pseudoalteromonas luteoviolacea]KZN30523.1 hypothetical protein N480_06080 [Pseudoalteromonas luteoviolacea S2607]KZN61298.1 hypothetical protein N478_04335 [Pseudoalteromonas luteoviolacea S4060-1]